MELSLHSTTLLPTFDSVDWHVIFGGPTGVMNGFTTTIGMMRLFGSIWSEMNGSTIGTGWLLD